MTSKALHLSRDELSCIERYLRAASHVSAGQIYLLDSPPLREPRLAGQVETRLPGH